MVQITDALLLQRAKCTKLNRISKFKINFEQNYFKQIETLCLIKKKTITEGFKCHSFSHCLYWVLL